MKRTPSQNRKSKRREVWNGARIALRDGSTPKACRMLDISDGGARLEVANADALPDHFSLLLSYDGRMYRHCAIVWRSETTIGVEFIPDFPKVVPA